MLPSELENSKANLESDFWIDWCNFQTEKYASIKADKGESHVLVFWNYSANWIFVCDLQNQNYGGFCNLLMPNFQ